MNIMGFVFSPSVLRIIVRSDNRVSARLKIDDLDAADRILFGRRRPK